MYPLTYEYHIGPQYTGTAIHGQIMYPDGSNYGSPISSGTVEDGNGFYSSTILIPEQHRGKVKFYATGSANLPLAAFAINPEEAENLGTIEGTINFVQWMRLIGAVLFGKLTGAGTATIAFRDTNDSKNRITATVTTQGNRTTVTLDGS